jgi:hypothetical protein
MKLAILIEPTIECLEKILNAIHEHCGKEEFKNIEIHEWNDSINKATEFLAIYKNKGLVKGQWFTVNNHNEVSIISWDDIEPLKASNYPMEKIIELLSDR